MSDAEVNNGDYPDPFCLVSAPGDLPDQPLLLPQLPQVLRLLKEHVGPGCQGHLPGGGAHPQLHLAVCSHASQTSKIFTKHRTTAKPIDLTGHCQFNPSQVILQQTKSFVCQCPRCLDPSENGANLAALKCPACKVGTVLPIQPLDLGTNLKCGSCGEEIDSGRVGKFKYFHLY